MTTTDVPGTSDADRALLREHLRAVREGVEKLYKPSRERSLVATKLDEAIMWLARAEAL
jgi:hypothetical protein